MEGHEHEAVANARRRLALQKQAVGDGHPDYAAALNQLALLLIMHGDPDQAEPLLWDALEIRREALGEDHPDYATNLSSLGGLLWARGDVDGAEPLLRRAFEIRRDVLGPDHPKSAASWNSLEQLLRTKEDQAEVEPVASGNSPPPPANGPAPVAEPPVAASPRPASAVNHAQVPETALEGPREGAAEKAGPVASQVRVALVQRHEALVGEFSRVGERLAWDAERWREEGVPPSEAIVAELAATGREFDALRDDVLRLAEAQGVAAAPGDLPDLQKVGALLRELGVAESRLSQLEAVRRQALLALSRVLSLVHPDQQEFPPLLSCQAKARDLHRAISGAPLLGLPPEATQLAEGDHPFNGLLILVEGTEGLSDDLWAYSLEAVEREFGKPLSVAVARAKVVLPAEAGLAGVIR